MTGLPGLWVSHIFVILYNWVVDKMKLFHLNKKKTTIKLIKAEDSVGRCFTQSHEAFAILCMFKLAEVTLKLFLMQFKLKKQKLLSS